MRHDSLTRSDDRGHTQDLAENRVKGLFTGVQAGDSQQGGEAPRGQQRPPKAPRDKGKGRVATAQEEPESQRRGPQTRTEVTMEFSLCQDSH